MDNCFDFRAAREPEKPIAFLLWLPGGVENQDKVDKLINARDLMLPGRGGKRDKMDKWIKQAITRSLLLSASYPRLSTIYPVDNLESTS